MWVKGHLQEYVDFDSAENRNLFEAITNLMDDAIREEVHNEAAPCSNRYFIESYIEKQPEFEQVLAEEFGIEWM